MKTKAEKLKQSEKPAKGRSKFIHGLRARGVSKSEALAKTREKFACADNIFERIWNRGQRKEEKKS